MTRASRPWFAYALFFSLALLWAHAIRAIYLDSGLFWWVGTDFGQYYAQSMALWSGTPSNIYHPESYSQLYQELLSRYIFNRQPVPPTSVPYPPVFAWLFTPFTIPSPLVGFALWEAVNILGALYLAWRVINLFPYEQRVIVAVIVLTSFPLVESLFLAQPQVLLACAVGECYLALRTGRDFAAGLWLSCLLIKPQYGLLIGLFLIWKRRWWAVAGAALGGVVVVSLSIVIAGWDTLLAYPSALAEMAVFQGYWEQNMINWRSLVLAARPGVSTLKGMLLTQFLAALTVIAVMIVSRGPWKGETPVFSVQFTLVIISTLLVMHHSMMYGAVMLVLPVAAVFSERLASEWTRWSVLGGAIVPVLSFTLWPGFNIPLTARLMTFALLSCYGSLLLVAWQKQYAASSLHPVPERRALNVDARS